MSLLRSDVINFDLLKKLERGVIVKFKMMISRKETLTFNTVLYLFLFNSSEILCPP